MPAQIPREATDFFGSLLLPYIPEMLLSNAKKSFEEYGGNFIVKNAVIASNGKLAPNFEYISDLRKASKKSGRLISEVLSSAHKAALRQGEKRVLILGAGYVARPAIEYLSRDENTIVTIASQLRDELDAVNVQRPNVDVMLLDILRNQEELDSLIPQHDVVVSLLPYAYHTDIAKLCLKHKVNMVTASYVSPAMAELHESAKECGITILNEVGVDPGIDHMLAMQCFDEVKNLGGKITSYVSWCGGLPAPEFSDSPLRYKFSWFPKGVLMNTLSSARYIKDGKVVDIPGNGGLMDATEPLDFLPGFNLEGFPNRDSTQYAKSYGIETAHTVLRGTLRYKGFTEAAKALLAFGFLDSKPHSSLHPSGPLLTWKGLMCQHFGKSSDTLSDSVKDLILEKLKGNKQQLATIINLGLLSDDPVDKRNTPIDTLSNYLAKRLAYGPEERDMILMHHDVEIKWADGQLEQRYIDLVNYGDVNGASAMAKTVGIPTGIATKMVLDGEIQRKGVVVPFTLDLYQPILSRLAQEGIKATEKIRLI